SRRDRHPNATGNHADSSCPPPLLVPTLCVGTQAATLRVASRTRLSVSSIIHGTQSVPACVPTRSVGTRSINEHELVRVEQQTANARQTVLASVRAQGCSLLGTR